MLAPEKCLYGRTVLDEHCLRLKGARALYLNVRLCQYARFMQAQLALAPLTKTPLARI
jgi:hypothetical protein